MAAFTKIDRTFWESDEGRELTPEEKYFWIYLQSNSRVNTVGCYKFRMRKAMDETGYNKETIEKLLQRIRETGLIRLDEKTLEVFLVHFEKLCWNRKTATVRAIVGDLKDIESEELLGHIQKRLKIAGIPPFAEEETDRNTWEQAGTNGNKRGEEEEEEEEEEKRKEKKKKKKESFLPATKGDGYTEEFETFWAAYPNKKNKGTAAARWDKLKISSELLPKIMDGLARAKESHEWSKDGGEFIPHPATWLNAKGWESEYRPAELPKTPPEAPKPKEKTNDALLLRRQMRKGC